MAPKMSNDDTLPMSSEAPPADSPAEKMYPKKIKMTHLYGYYDELNRYRSWQAGDIITDPNEIKLLVDRSPAPFIVLE